jgi:UTP-glucose-1-phosphate uridylyltransferase
MKPTLLILAGGMGSRYGGLKQFDPIGPNGETVIDYSIYDAVAVGFGKVVFVIRRYFEDAFRKMMDHKFDRLVKTVYAYQELDVCVNGFELPAGRKKPWGTGHALLTAGGVIDEPFAVINADDFYGSGSFKIMADYLSTPGRSDDEYSMIGYTLRNTLSEYGCVCRGVCRVDKEMLLRKIVEREKVDKAGDSVRYFDECGQEQHLTGDEVVSMNFWGFKPSIFDYLQSLFKQFLKEHGDDLDSEFFIPTAVDHLIVSGKIQVKVLMTEERWFGITYRDDRAIATTAVNKLIEQGRYPERLW